MLTVTPIVSRYIESFSLFVYRMLDLTRMAPMEELKSTLTNEVIFLYNCLYTIITNNNSDNYANKNINATIDSLVNWAALLGSDIPINTFQDMYIEKLTQLNVAQEFTPNNNKFVFSFTTIWDSIHLMCLIADDIVSNRHMHTYDAVMTCLTNFKWIFYNMFIILFCPICAKHFLTVDTFPYEFERVQVALYREKMGEALQLTDELTRNQSHKNVLLKNHLLYKSMEFHNHVNNYRPIQYNNDEFNMFQRMNWTMYKSLLNIKN